MAERARLLDGDGPEDQLVQPSLAPQLPEQQLRVHRADQLAQRLGSRGDDLDRAVVSTFPARRSSSTLTSSSTSGSSASR